MDLTVGLGGAARDACVAVCSPDRVLGVCPQERVTRVRGAGLNPTGLPDEALDELLRQGGATRRDITRYVLGESVAALESAPGIVRIDHHAAHACSAFLTSPFGAATVVVCDDESPEVSVWEGRGAEVTRVQWPWRGIGFATLYSEFARLLGFAGGAQEQRMEALARLEPTADSSDLEQIMGPGSDHVRLESDWRDRVATWLGKHAPTPGVPASAAAASALQSRLGDLLVELLRKVKRRGPADACLCVTGRLFYNSYFNSRVRNARVFDEVFVPVDPGNPGLAVGMGLLGSGNSRRGVSPFLGPAYGPEHTKQTLDNCKLTYAWMSETDTIAAAVDALVRGRLVGWFDGAMEWGPRTLGARSIVANPFDPYVLENLNRFLKHRDPWRGYAMSGLHEAVRQHFDGPDHSPFMECDYLPRDGERFRHVLPAPNAAVRLHTVGDDGPTRFARLLRAFGDATGVPLLVNTSFNGFQEPVVCTPRDALRVFYGTGIDVLVMEPFVVSKEPPSPARRPA